MRGCAWRVLTALLARSRHGIALFCGAHRRLEVVAIRDVAIAFVWFLNGGLKDCQPHSNATNARHRDVAVVASAPAIP